MCLFFPLIYIKSNMYLFYALIALIGFYGSYSDNSSRYSNNAYCVIWVVCVICANEAFWDKRTIFFYLWSLCVNLVSGIFIILVGLGYHFYSVDKPVQKITWRKCQEDLMVALDIYRSNCLKHSQHLGDGLSKDKLKLILDAAENHGPDEKASFILDKQCVLAFFTYRLLEFNNVGPAVAQASDFLRNKKNIPPERAEELSQWMDNVLLKLQKLVNIVAASENYDALNSAAIPRDEVRALEEGVIVLLYHLSLDFSLNISTFSRFFP